MIIITVLLIALLCLGIKNNVGDSLSRNNTETWKGFGILIVFIDHIRGYFNQSEPLFSMSIDPQLLLAYGLGTKYMVCTFLFFSGYGVTNSIITKGKTYVEAMPQRRLFPTLLNFDIAVCFFLIIDLFLQVDVPIEDFVLSLIAWESIGNSNWYIFAIMCCYIFSYLSFFFTKNAKYSILIITVLTLFYIAVMGQIKEPWWSNVILSYTGGGLYALFKVEIEKKMSTIYWLMFFTTLILFALLFKFSSNLLICNLSALVFNFIILLLSMRFTFDNNILRWFGKNLFPIYIYQRIPMLVISNKWPELVIFYPYMYFILCLIITIIIARYCYQYKFKN